MNYFIRIIASVTICCLTFMSIAQDGLHKRSKDPNFHPYFYYEGKLYETDSVRRNERLLYAFVEGDSAYVVRYYGSLDSDTSFVKKIFGAKRNKGIDFCLSEKTSSRLKMRDFKKYLKQENVLIKIGIEPLATKEDLIGNLNIDKIKPFLVVKNFKLTKWDTGEEKAYTLLVVSRIR